MVKFSVAQWWRPCYLLVASTRCLEIYTYLSENCVAKHVEKSIIWWWIVRFEGWMRRGWKFLLGEFRVYKDGGSGEDERASSNINYQFFQLQSHSTAINFSLSFVHQRNNSTTPPHNYSQISPPNYITHPKWPTSTSTRASLPSVPVLLQPRHHLLSRAEYLKSPSTMHTASPKKKKQTRSSTSQSRRCGRSSNTTPLSTTEV